MNRLTNIRYQYLESAAAYETDADTLVNANGLSESKAETQDSSSLYAPGGTDIDNAHGHPSADSTAITDSMPRRAAARAAQESLQTLYEDFGPPVSGKRRKSSGTTASRATTGSNTSSNSNNKENPPVRPRSNSASNVEKSMQKSRSRDNNSSNDVLALNPHESPIVNSTIAKTSVEKKNLFSSLLEKYRHHFPGGDSTSSSTIIATPAAKQEPSSRKGQRSIASSGKEQSSRKRRKPNVD